MNHQSFFTGNIEELTTSNDAYRKVLFTTCTQQLVLMSLLPNEEIGTETHPYTTQFIRVESGECKAVINGKEVMMKAEDAIVIPPNAEHNIINTSDAESLKLYTIYSPPEHPDGLVQEIKPGTDELENKEQTGGTRSRSSRSGTRNSIKRVHNTVRPEHRKYISF